jgi:5-methyltetrahydropteroyltriglutamate--homocysteine methyltransferase
MGEQMSRSEILTSHAGSLPRPDDLIEANRARLAGETDDDAIAGDIANFRAALDAAGETTGFMTSVGPASAVRVANEFYATDEEFVWACAEATHHEYKAITDAGLILQTDDPSIAESWDQINPEPSVADYQRYTMHSVEALNLGKLARPAHDRYRHA